MIASVWLLAASLLQSPAPAAAAPVTTDEAACDLTKTRVAERDHFPVSVVAFCDVAVSDRESKDYYVLALHSARKCEGICSTHMGWYAVEKATGQVFEWDMVEDKLGQPVQVSR